jgi:TonB-linked SusC/RagA family outer membrane protein
MPNHPVYTPEGKFFAQGGWGNAVAQAKEGATATFLSRSINTNFKLITDITDELKLNLQGGVNFRTDKDEDIAKPIPLYNWDGTLAYYDIASPGLGSLTLTNTENTYRNFTAYAEYDKAFGDHELGIMAGASHEENDWQWFNARRDNFISEELWSINLGGTNNMSNNGGGNHWAISSVFSRISYSFNNEYLLDANLRYDGSSRFASESRWGFFPGISIAWRLSEKNFIRNIGVIDDLKLRMSYGETGNQEGVGLYDHLQLIITTARNDPYPFGPGSQTRSASLAGMVATNRTWETLVNQNVGLDASLLRSRLTFTFDYFIKRNKNLLIPVTYPSLLGAVPPYSNSGELKTNGFEMTLGWKDKLGKFEYSARVLLSDARNKLVDYGGADTYKPGLNWVREGYPLDSYFAYQFDGLIRDQKELDEYKQIGGVPSDIGIGDARFKDINGDGVISPYSNTPGQDGDVINVGTIMPRYTFGINLGARYGNFDLIIFAQGVAKRTLFREGEYSIPWTDWWRQPPQFYYGKTWNEDRPQAEYPRLSHGNIRWWNYQASTLQKINAAYIRLKNIQVGYTIPNRVMQRVSISSARIYFSGQDIWELHGVKGGWDPESSNNGFNYPFQRMYSFGVDVTF